MNLWTSNPLKPLKSNPKKIMNVSELFSLKGKNAVVIGGTGVLCGTMAEGLAAAGAHCVLVGRDEKKASSRMETIRALGGSAEFEACQVDDSQSIQELFRKLVDRLGTLDILVNGAGVNSPTPFLEIKEEELERILNINLKAVVYSCQAFGKHILERKGEGSIINVGSVSGVMPISKVFTYSVSKAGVHNLTKNLAREWATRGIRVNTLVPGFFPAEQNRKILTEERISQVMNHTPMKRFGKAEELIGATLLLASDAGSFITGHEMVVDGGFTSMFI